jgi:fructose-1,6-bisphosphatase/sedoheptulose 1,7-bisphosphatase-like protein
MFFRQVKDSFCLILVFYFIIIKRLFCQETVRKKLAKGQVSKFFIVYARTMVLGEGISPGLEGHATSVRPLERRIASTLPQRTDSADLSQVFPVVAHISEVAEGSIDSDQVQAAISQELSVFHEIEARMTQMEAMVGDAVFAAADSLVGLDPLGDEIKKKDPEMIKRKDLIDVAATESMHASIARFDFGVDAHGEGGRDIRDNGQNVPLVEGKLGNGEIEYALESDAIDNTEAAARGKKGSISVAALAPIEGLRVVDDEHHQKLIIPETVNADITDDEDTIMEAIMADAGFNTPEERARCIVTSLDRDANESIINAARKSGATLITPDGGDVLPVVTAGKQADGTVRVVFTRGGGPELTIAAGIVKARNSASKDDPNGRIKLQARRWYEDPAKMAEAAVITHDDIAPADNVIVAIAHLTDDPDNTGQAGVPIYTKEPSALAQAVNTTLIDSRGVTFSKYKRSQQIAA